MQLAQGLGLSMDRVWMVELDSARGQKCRELLPGAHILAPCSFLQTDIAYGSFSLVYSNPPFDDSADRGIRVEEQFLQRSLMLLKPGGVLLFVCPECITYRSGFTGLLSRYCQNISIEPFPRLVRKHDEVFVLAQRIDGLSRKPPSWRDLLAKSPHAKYQVPPAPGPGLRFTKTGLTDEEMAEALAKSPLLSQFAAPPEFTLPRPPLALGKGHLALLLAGGYLDGLVTLPGHVTHVVRGSAKKVDEVTDEEVEVTKGQRVTKKTITERISLRIRAVWPDGNITTLE